MKVCCSCQLEIKVGSKYYLEGNGDEHHQECFDEFADEDYRFKFNDYGLHTHK